ncbi:MAG: MOSC domain-containing protein [Clostridiales bacterium]|nr:MOSC domain-containing protein [Clostridiales bacterium]
MGTIKAICISEKRGTPKYKVNRAEFVKDWGIRGDAHAGNWHRQVSFLSFEKIEAFRAKGAQVDFGAFGENVIADGLDFKELPVGTRLRCGDVEFVITQIGKECHSHCQIFRRMGECIMPHEGVFAVVEKGGWIQVGDQLEQLPTIR